MRGFLLGALVLIGMDVFLSSPAARIANVLTPFTTVLVNWLDPTVPLISDHAGAAAAGRPAPEPGPVKQVAGHCPPGHIPDPAHPGFCQVALGAH